ncbi:DUF6285 domain-containing protein [Aquidulcibacter sp.]|jgi:hypothetical protein|uniref:DUF6285 domain-containing protein n=1 Tax=Aquidulcibacter sp. TaxID=2052990 RepID=UPI0037C14940
MHEAPSSEELLGSVIGFLNQVAAPQLSGQAAFHARVAANALALVEREMAQRPTADTRARALFAALLNDEASTLEALNGQVCAQIRSGDLACDNPSLLATLREITSAQLAIDQPSYSGLNP